MADEKSDEKIRLARVAISNGITRGRFIAEHTGHIPSKPLERCLAACQSWSEAYSEAMWQIQDESKINR